MLPNLEFEKKLWQKGNRYVCAVDEVGRGSFAGPVVAGAVILQNTSVKLPGQPKIDDSKKMTARQREAADKWIRKNSLAWGIGETTVGKINKLGMGKATKIAFRKAISETRRRLGKPIDFLLADAFFVSHVPGLPTKRRKNKRGKYRSSANGRQLAIIHGDEKSVSIAAASVIAKVYRDRLMARLGETSKYKKYGWAKNKGYGTKIHQNAIQRYGVTRLHRRVFVETFLGHKKT